MRKQGPAWPTLRASVRPHTRESQTETRDTSVSNKPNIGSNNTPQGDSDNHSYALDASAETLRSQLFAE